MLSERSQTQKATSCDSIHMKWGKTCKPIETECGLVARGWESVERGATVE